MYLDSTGVEIAGRGRKENKRHFKGIIQEKNKNSKSI